MAEARNLRNMTIAQTPLLGDENTPLHSTPGEGTGFESATPRHQVAFTPNPLATPRDPSMDPSMTPRADGSILATPLRTPMRDSLSINPGDGMTPMAPSTPRELRLKESSTKRALKAGFMNLPKPENNFELLVPEDEEPDESIIDGVQLSQEDAAERDARVKKRIEEQQRKELARRSQAIQRELPRPANVDITTLMEELRVDDADTELAPALQMVHAEMAKLLEHDSIVHPIPGTSRPGGSLSGYELPPDDFVDLAKAAVHMELAASLGFPDASADQIRQGLAATTNWDEVDDVQPWAAIRQELVLDPSTRLWAELGAVPPEQRIAGYNSQLEESREKMAREASKTSKTEKKLNVTLGGYQVRSKALAKRVTDAFAELQQVKTDYESFARLKSHEEITGPGRITTLRDEVERLERREKLLQARYAELEADKRETDARVGALEEKIMLEAEAMNEAALAEMEAQEA
jgi:pre-mRNA-splicing factor CDC5/CEF1